MPEQPDTDDDVVQMNVRIPRSLRDAIDERRAVKGLTRDRWVANAARFALAQHDTHQTPAGRTARRRPPRQENTP